MKLLTTKNLKTEKGLSEGYSTGILMLAPFKLSGVNVCPKATKGCSDTCLNTSGHGRYQRTQKARLRRTMQYLNEREQFLADLIDDITTLVRRAKKNALTPAIRINGTSDLPALAINIAKMFPNEKFYDYTKVFKTLLRKDLPANYHLTFSRSESNWNECLEALKLGFNVSVLFEKMPETYKGFKVINGDKTDLRFLDEKGVIVGLTPKGKAKHDKTGFVVRD